MYTINYLEASIICAVSSLLCTNTLEDADTTEEGVSQRAESGSVTGRVLFEDGTGSLRPCHLRVWSGGFHFREEAEVLFLL